MSAWSALERAALLGTRREKVQLPAIEAALDTFLQHLERGDAAHTLLAAAGALDLYEQIGRSPARLREDAASPLPDETLDPCPMEAASYLAQMLSGMDSKLLPEFLAALQRNKQRVPETLLPNLLALGQQRPALRAHLLPVLGSRGRWLAGRHKQWQYAAVNPASWSSIRQAWETIEPAQRPALVAQLREVDCAQGRALVESVWRGEQDAQRLRLIKELSTNLSLADEPLLESALDDRHQLVRRKAAELLAQLPQSRLCRRMGTYVPAYLAWTPQATRQISVTLPDVTPAMRRDGIVGVKSSVEARVRSQEIIQLISAVPLSYWQDTWHASPQEIIRAIRSTAWPRTLTGGFALAAARQSDGHWARAIIEEFGLVPATIKVIPALNEIDITIFTHRALAGARQTVLTKDSELVKILRSWPGAWDAELSLRLVAVFAHTFQLPTEARSANHLVRDAFARLAKQASVEIAEEAQILLGDLRTLGPWRGPAADFLHTLRFRRGMLGALAASKVPGYAHEENRR